MNKKEQPKIMSVDSLIALSNILDSYEEFDKNIQNAITEKNYLRVSNDLLKITKKEKLIGGKIAKKLYNENKKTINTISKYSSISSFLHSNDKWHGTTNQSYYPSHDLDYFYNYIDKNKDKLDQIKSVLNKIRKLGITNLELDENLNFNNKEYRINTSFHNNHELHYVANPIIIPNYNPTEVKYKTNESPYEITTKPDSFSWAIFKKDISKYNTEIKLNSLAFDKDKLPNKIDVSTVFEKLIYLKYQVKNICNNIENYIDLNINIEDLRKEVDIITNNIMENSDFDDKKAYIHETITNINESIKILEALNENYKDKLIKGNNCTNEQLEKELKEAKILRKTI